MLESRRPLLVAVRSKLHFIDRHSFSGVGSASPTFTAFHDDRRRQ